MNWGYKITIVFIAFAGMIGYMVYRCTCTNVDLVEPEYYKSELKYQEIINSSGNANALSASPIVKQQGRNITLQLPDEMKNSNITGSVLFYCAYDAKKDKKIPLAADKDGFQSFATSILPGIYTVKIDWHKGGKQYYAEQSLTVL